MIVRCFPFKVNFTELFNLTELWIISNVSTSRGKILFLKHDECEYGVTHGRLGAYPGWEWWFHWRQLQRRWTATWPQPAGGKNKEAHRATQRGEAFLHAYLVQSFTDPWTFCRFSNQVSNSNGLHKAIKVRKHTPQHQFHQCNSPVIFTTLQ